MGKEFEIQVKTALMRRNKNLSWLAETLGISVAYLCDILAGNRKAIKQRERIIAILELKEN